ncbi:Eukaryotic translation initiation factor eIF-1 [Zalaria obscura]|uniref:Eukaryotic translation initiation factor eIF-1 n=1 Tax=Zalaria obscura TaxID=2024903 RepID=A0ACC3SCQ7_9PEZI
MASKKDMRREDLIVPYMEPAVQKNEGDIQGTYLALRQVMRYMQSSNASHQAQWRALCQWLLSSPGTSEPIR